MTNEGKSSLRIVKIEDEPGISTCYFLMTVSHTENFPYSGNSPSHNCNEIVFACNSDTPSCSLMMLGYRQGVLEVPLWPSNQKVILKALSETVYAEDNNLASSTTENLDRIILMATSSKRFEHV